MIFQNLEGIREKTHLFTFCIAGSAEIVKSFAFSDKLTVSQELWCFVFLKAVKELGGIHCPYKGLGHLPKFRHSVSFGMSQGI